MKKGDRVVQGPGHRRRSLHRHGRAGARTQRAGGLHAVARLQLRGRDPGLREDGEGGLLHLRPHRGVRDRIARHQAGTGRSHARHSQRQRVGAARSRRERRHPHRRDREGRRHPGGQGNAEGRDPAHAGREAAARHLRRKGRRCSRRFAHLPSGYRGHGGRREDLLPQGTGEGRARQVHRGRAGCQAGEEPGGRNPNPDRRAFEASGSAAGRQGSSGRPARRAHQQAPVDQGRDARPRHHRAHLDAQPEAHQVTPTRTRASTSRSTKSKR